MGRSTVCALLVARLHMPFADRHLHSFGKFGSHYLKREFYFDVHPPLGKMLVGLSGYLAGYNGSFEFKSGETYPDELNYKFMRQFNSAFGALCVPLAYYTAKEMHFKKPTVWLVTMAVLFENSYTTISRFILLDSMLLFFTFTTVFCWAKWHNMQQKPFTPEWGLWLGLTGISIGCVCSVKWVGMFGTALVGLYTIEDLWSKFGDLKMPPVSSMFLAQAQMLNRITDHARRTPRLPRRWPDRHPNDCIHGFILGALLHSRKQRTWRCTDELSIPSQPQGHRSWKGQSAGSRIRLKSNVEEHGIWWRSLALACANLPRGLVAATDHLLSPQGLEQRVVLLPQSSRAGLRPRRAVAMGRRQAGHSYDPRPDWPQSTLSSSRCSSNKGGLRGLLLWQRDSW